MKNISDALFLSTYTLNFLFVLGLIFCIVLYRKICEVCQALSTLTISPVSGARCYIIRDKLLHHTGQVVTSYGTRCYIIRDKMLHHTGQVVKSYGTRCYIIRDKMLHHTGQVITANKCVDRKASVTRI